MIQSSPNPIVHLELHSGSLASASSLYSQVCGWPIERVGAGQRSYHILDWGGTLEGGIVECATDRAMWLPYVEVASADEATELARRLGATALLGPTEGPAGWRSVVTVAAGGEIAFWQFKTPGVR